MCRVTYFRQQFDEQINKRIEARKEVREICGLESFTRVASGVGTTDSNWRRLAYVHDSVWHMVEHIKMFLASLGSKEAFEDFKGFDFEAAELKQRALKVAPE